MRLLRSQVNAIASVGVLVQVMTVISGPLVARMLGPAGRGDLFMVMVVATIGAQLGSASLSAAVSHAVARAGGAARDVLGANLRLWFLWSAVPAAGAGVAAGWLLHDASLWPALAVGTLLLTLFACWLNILTAMLQGEGAIARVNGQRIVFSSIYVASVVAIFVLHPSNKAAVLLTPFMAAQVVGLCLSWAGLRRPTGDTTVRVPRSDVHRFARRAFVATIGALDSLGLDALVVGLLVSQTELGLYAVAASVTALPVMALGGIAAALLPQMAARSQGDAVAVMRRWLLGALIVDVALVVGLELVVAPAIHIFFGDEFVPAITCARILIIARALLAMRMALAAAAQAQGRGGRTSAIELVSSILLLVAMVIAVPRAGIEGAAACLLATAAFSCLCLVWLIGWRRDAEFSSTSRELDVGRSAQ